MFHPDPDFTRYCATGNEAAFRGMVTAHLPMVLGVAARRLGPHAQLAPDVAQAVFTRLARVAKGLPQDLIVASWLHRQAVRLAIDAVRHEERRLRRETTAAMLHTPDSSPPPATEIGLLLDEALDQLPATDRSLLVLRYLEDRDFASIAQSLGSTPEAARKRIARSLEKLRTLLSHRGVMLGTATLSGFLTEQSALAASTAVAQTALRARISSTALQSAATASNTSAILTTALMSHATALSAGALAALLACGLFYQQRETEISTRTAELARAVTLAVKKESVRSDGSVGSSTAPLPQTLPEIIAALVEITDGPDTRAVRERIAILLRCVPPEQYLEFYVHAEQGIHPLRWLGLDSQATEEWRGVDPAALVQALVGSNSLKLKILSEAALHGNAVLNGIEISSSGGGSYGMSSNIYEIFDQWLKLDCGAATSWLEKERDSPFLRLPCMRESTVYHGLAERAATAVGGQTDLGNVRGETMPLNRNRALETAWADGRIKAAGGLEAALHSARDQEEAAAIARHFAYTHAPECRTWAEQTDDGSLKFAAALGMVAQFSIRTADSNRTLHQAERLERADFALKNRDEVPLGQALADITTAWLRGATDPDPEFFTWIKARGGAETAGALTAGARRMAIAGFSPDALKWAAAVPDAAQRSPLLHGIYQRWHDAEPVKAAEFLTTAPPDLAVELSVLPKAP